VDLERMANILLDEFRGGKLGRITLEMPEDLEEAADGTT
jgi:ribosome biogenesis GTPase A